MLQPQPATAAAGTSCNSTKFIRSLKCHIRLGRRANPPRAQATAAASAAQATDALAVLESACAVRRAHIGVNPQGYRGLIAWADLSPGDVVVSVPLHNILQVPRQLTSAAAAAAAAAALEAWQQQHGVLPAALLDLILDPGRPWEAKLVAWLLHLKATEPQGSFWQCYCQALPAAEDTLSFFCYSEQQVEQLQFSTWKALAQKQRELLHEVQQACEPLYTGSSSSNSSSMQAPAADDVAWALSMVKSRTFGRQLPQQQQHNAGSPAQRAPPQGPAAAEPAAAAAAAELEPGGSDDDDSNVVLLMVPFIDMINHSPANNCSFSCGWSNGCFEIVCAEPILAGSEVTISYGSNKSNLALLSCYGFFIPGNPGDAQLLRPIFKGCLAAADGITGFDQGLVAAAAAAGLAHHDQQQQDEAQLARQQCAVAALPVTAAAVAVPDGCSVKEALQLQQYAAQLLLYQVRQMLRLCGTTAEEDTAALKEAAATSDRCSRQETVAAAVDQSVLATRLEQKLLLQESCYITISSSRLLLVSHRKAGVPAAAAPLTWFAWDLVEADDLYAAPLLGTALLALFRALQFAVFLSVIVFGNTVYQPAGGAFFLYFTNWTFVLFGCTALLGTVLTAREALRQRRPAIPCIEPSQPACHQAGAAPGWSCANRCYHLMLETACAASIMLTIFYWVADYVPGSSIRLDNPFKHGVSAGLLLLDLALSRAPLVSYHLQVVVGCGSIYMVFLWIYRTVSGVWVYRALDWAKPLAPVYYTALPLLLILAFVVMFLVVCVREALINRRSRPAGSRAGCDVATITASPTPHREFSFSKAASSKALTSPKKSKKQLQELAVQQQDDIGGSAGSSGVGSAGVTGGPPSPTVAILMK
uniref:SET domain-containing protein n=1 Tax=Tetradesmus obliquus TaxID=3088 RepID=A0A383V6P8_TETOB|eukprot:jgi/Sobl393_1/3968/SZX60462.1